MATLTQRWIAELGNESFALLADDPQRFPELIRAVVPPGFAFSVEPEESAIEVVDDAIALQLIVHLRAPSPASAPLSERTGHCDYEVDPDERALRIHTLDTPPALHGGGIGGGIVTRLHGLAGDLELDELQVEASKIGRWAWARWGFQFMNDDERDKVLHAAHKFARSLGRAPDLSAIRQPGDFAQLVEPITADEISHAGGPVIDHGRPVPLGKALLLGPPLNANNWLGRLPIEERQP